MTHTMHGLMLVMVVDVVDLEPGPTPGLHSHNPTSVKAYYMSRLVMAWSWLVCNAHRKYKNKMAPPPPPKRKAKRARVGGGDASDEDGGGDAASSASPSLEPVSVVMELLLSDGERVTDIGNGDGAITYSFKDFYWQLWNIVRETDVRGIRLCSRG